MDAVISLTPAQTKKAELSVVHAGYLHRLLIALDDFGNVAFLDGQDDETISSNTARMASKHEFVGTVVSKALDLIQKNHGAKAIAGDAERAKIVTNIEDKSGILNV